MINAYLSFMALKGFIPEWIKNNIYLYALLILLVYILASKIALVIIEKIFLRIAKKTKTHLDDLILLKIKKPLSATIFLIGIHFAVIPLEVHAKWVDIVSKTADSAIILTITWGIIGVVYILIDYWRNKWAAKTESKLDDNIALLLHTTARYILLVLSIIIILHRWGVNIVPLLGGLGIVGIAVAFAAQSTISNIFGGASMVVDKTIKVKDVIKLDTGEVGTVQEVGVRSTKILTFDNIVLSIPNGKLADSRIQNMSAPDAKIRVTLEIGVEYGSEPDKVKKVILDELLNLEDVHKEPVPVILFIAMADFSLKFRVLFWCNLDKKYPLIDLANTRIYNAFKKKGIGIPFPTRTVYLKKEN